MILVMAAGGTWCLENPQNSLIGLQPRFVWMVRHLQLLGIPDPSEHVCIVCRAEVYKVAFWMRKHHAMTFKRTWIWSLSTRISNLDLGRMSPQERVTHVRTAKHYKDKNGKWKWKGTKALKETQCFRLCYKLKFVCFLELRQYTFRFARNLIQLFPGFVGDKPYAALPPAP